MNLVEAHALLEKISNEVEGNPNVAIYFKADEKFFTIKADWPEKEFCTARKVTEVHLQQFKGDLTTMIVEWMNYEYKKRWG